MHTLSHKNATAVSRRPWMYDSSSQNAREKSTATQHLMHWARLLSLAPIAVTLSFSPITVDGNQNHKKANSRRHNKQPVAVPNALKTPECILFAYLLNRAVAERQVISVCFFFCLFCFAFCMSEQQQCTGWINNRGEADDMAQLYPEQPSQSQRVTEAPLYCCATVEGSSSLLLSSSHPLWSPTTVSFITHGTAGVCQGWLRVCTIHTRQREK